MPAPRPITIACDVGALVPDAVAVDALARLQLGARRLGLEIRLCRASRELQELLAFPGLRALVPCPAGGGPPRRPRQPIPGPSHQRRMSSRPLSHRSYGGIDCVASSWIREV